MKKLLLFSVSISVMCSLHAQTDTVPPVITLFGANPDTLLVYEQFIEPGFTAVDDHDGDLTDSVVISGTLDTGAIKILGVFWRDYTVSDSANNTTTVRRFVAVVDTVPPVIKLAGSALMQLALNAPFTEPGINVSDNFDPAPQVSVFGNLNTSQKGCYHLCYWAQDAAGNEALPLTRIIEVDNGCSTYDLNFCGKAVSGLVLGNIFHDKNNNCELDGNDELWPGGTVEAIPGNYIMNIGQDGNYALLLPGGSYQLVYHAPKYIIPQSCQPDTISINVVNGEIYDSIDFAMLAIPGVKDVAASVTAYFGWRARKGFTNVYQIDYGNFGAVPVSKVQVSIEHPQSAHFIYSSLTYDQYNGNKISWNLGTLQPGAYGIIFLNFSLDSSLQLGDTICYKSEITPFQNDMDIGNNSSTLCQRIVGAYDPNDKQCFPSGATPIGTKKLDYQIRFQNTGTDLASRMIVVDTLDHLLNTVEATVVSASHPYTLAVKNNILIWTFENIMLPDSNVDEPGSHGYIRFTAAIKDGANLGDTIRNRAYIYFDINPPVETNTTVNIISEQPDGIVIKNPRSKHLIIYPNPANEVLNIRNQVLQGSGQVSLINILGQQVSATSLSTQGEATLNVKNLPAGMYILLFENSKEAYKVIIFHPVF